MARAIAVPINVTESVSINLRVGRRSTRSAGTTTAANRPKGAAHHQGDQGGQPFADAEPVGSRMRPDDQVVDAIERRLHIGRIARVNGQRKSSRVTIHGRECERPASAGRQAQLTQVGKGEPLQTLRAFDEVAGRRRLSRARPQEGEAIVLDERHRPGSGDATTTPLSRRRRDGIRRLRVASNVGNALCQARVGRALFRSGRPSARDAIGRVDVRQPADQCFRVLTQIDRSKVRLGLLGPETLRAQREAADNRGDRQHRQPRRHIVPHVAHRAEEHQQRDRAETDQPQAPQTWRVVLEMGDLMREDGGDFFDGETFEKQVEEQHPVAGERRQREGVHQRPASASHAPYLRRVDARAPEHVLKAFVEIGSREARGSEHEKQHPHVPAIPGRQNDEGRGRGPPAKRVRRVDDEGRRQREADPIRPTRRRTCEAATADSGEAAMFRRTAAAACGGWADEGKDLKRHNPQRVPAGDDADPDRARGRRGRDALGQSHVPLRQRRVVARGKAMSPPQIERRWQERQRNGNPQRVGLEQIESAGHGTRLWLSAPARGTPCRSPWP
jgi:hypothetical protein